MSIEKAIDYFDTVKKENIADDFMTIEEKEDAQEAVQEAAEAVAPNITCDKDFVADRHCYSNFGMDKPCRKPENGKDCYSTDKNSSSSLMTYNMTEERRNNIMNNAHALQEADSYIIKSGNYLPSVARFDQSVKNEDDFKTSNSEESGGGKKPAKKPKRKANKTKRVKKSNKKKRKPKRKTLRKIKKIIFR